VDLELAQDLGPPGVVQVQPRHNDHIHVRLPPAG
jgi:hypothetical protein